MCLNWPLQSWGLCLPHRQMSTQQENPEDSCGTPQFRGRESPLAGQGRVGEREWAPLRALTWDLRCGLLPWLVGAAPALRQEGGGSAVRDRRVTGGLEGAQLRPTPPPPPSQGPTRGHQPHGATVRVSIHFSSKAGEAAGAPGWEGAGREVGPGPLSTWIPELCGLFSPTPSSIDPRHLPPPHSPVASRTLTWGVRLVAG